MKGPEMKCPNCGMPLIQTAHWSEQKGKYFVTKCPYCKWDEDKVEEEG